jgi:hypothetical protein
MHFDAVDKLAEYTRREFFATAAAGFMEAEKGFCRVKKPFRLNALNGLTQEHKSVILSA